MKVTIQYADDTFITDYPVRISDGRTLYDCPECIPSDIRSTVDFVFDNNYAYDVAMAIREAVEHGHPNWSHMFAYGPCTKPSAYNGKNIRLASNERVTYNMDGYTRVFP